MRHLRQSVVGICGVIFSISPLLLPAFFTMSSASPSLCFASNAHRRALISTSSTAWLYVFAPIKDQVDHAFQNNVRLLQRLLQSLDCLRPVLVLLRFLGVHATSTRACGLQAVVRAPEQETKPASAACLVPWAWIPPGSLCASKFVHSPGTS